MARTGPQGSKATRRTRLMASRANGFSLIELLVTLFVLALLATVAVLSLPGGGTELRRSAESFAARTGAARNEAIVSARPVAVVVGPAGYYFEERRDGGWQPPDARSLQGGDWPSGVTLSGQEGNRRIIFDPVGLASADARLALTRDGHTAVVSIARNGDIRTEAR